MINNISTLSSQRTFLGGFSKVSDLLPVFVRRQQCPRCLAVMSPRSKL